uniref:Uncharacterized protein n=1 Tax=Physcomitrium patens TaxID=3218 RepID=A0A2K1JJE9_PHYPA|nr:hypothetical protein PHYPA_019076 [Physcomitrium patens]
MKFCKFTGIVVHCNPCECRIVHTSSLYFRRAVMMHSAVLGVVVFHVYSQCASSHILSGFPCFCLRTILIRICSMVSLVIWFLADFFQAFSSRPCGSWKATGCFSEWPWIFVNVSRRPSRFL